MGLISSNKLEKLKITAYTDEKRHVESGTFEAMFNPESYSFAYENVYSKSQGINTSGRKLKYALSKPSLLSIKLILDGTGATEYLVSEMRYELDVSKRIRKFLELTTFMDGTIHEPKYLKIDWGMLIFKCRLQDVKINYTLFDKAGKPLRAELDTSFIGELDEVERLKRENKSSPDLTHKRVVASHDTLPLLCKEVYGSEHYYIQVAKANNLDNFRDLTPGLVLYFPPVKK